MQIKSKIIKSEAIKIFIKENGQEIGRAYLYLIKNQLRGKPYGLIEDVFVDEIYRSKGLGKKLVKELIKTAKKNQCYKIVATSRYGREKVHQLYKKLGFSDFGKEFKMYLKK